MYTPVILSAGIWHVLYYLNPHTPIQKKDYAEPQETKTKVHQARKHRNVKTMLVFLNTASCNSW